jgi:predicted ThiF/HesA family dinucleotide-utilizing enzyme
VQRTLWGAAGLGCVGRFGFSERILGVNVHDDIDRSVQCVDSRKVVDDDLLRGELPRFDHLCEGVSFKFEKP